MPHSRPSTGKKTGAGGYTHTHTHKQYFSHTLLSPAEGLKIESLLYSNYHLPPPPAYLFQTFPSFLLVTVPRWNIIILSHVWVHPSTYLLPPPAGQEGDNCTAMSYTESKKPPTPPGFSWWVGLSRHALNGMQPLLGWQHNILCEPAHPSTLLLWLPFPPSQNRCSGRRRAPFRGDVG